ncbi:hypothetical protein AgCh_011989 [Apium graveolens]
MARLQQTQRKRVGSVPRLPADIVAAIAAENGISTMKVGFYQFRVIRLISSLSHAKGCLFDSELAGINVLSLVNEHSGASFQYGIDKDFSNESRNVVFYDIGSNSTYAALVCFSAYKAKEFGKTVSVN